MPNHCHYYNHLPPMLCMFLSMFSTMCNFFSKVVFKTDIYGTFRQTIVFDFGVEMILMREVQVESAPATDPEKIRKEIPAVFSNLRIRTFFIKNSESFYSAVFRQ